MKRDVSVVAPSARRAPKEKPTTRIPVCFRKSRRESSLIMTNLPALFVARAALRNAQCRGAFHGAHDPHVRSAAAQVAVERRANLRSRGTFVSHDERRSRHDHSVDAVAALRGLL